jgi:hypothetical protein
MELVLKEKDQELAEEWVTVQGRVELVRVWVWVEDQDEGLVAFV